MDAADSAAAPMAPMAPVAVAKPRMSKTKWIIVAIATVAVLGALVLAVVLVMKKRKQKAACDPACGEHGTCTDGACVCEDGWGGTTCEEPAEDEEPPRETGDDKTVQKVRIVSNGQTGSSRIINLEYLQIVTTDNKLVSQTGTATQSSTYTDNTDCKPPGCTADLALDPNDNRFSATLETAETWWQVVLPAPVSVFKIQIKARGWNDITGKTSVESLNRIEGKKVELYHKATDASPYKTVILARELYTEIVL